MGFLNKTALFLVIVGALNWFTIGLFQFDFVAMLLGGSMTMAARIVYALVGLAGIWCISLLFRDMDTTDVEVTKHVVRD